ncbi:MAG: chitobiase/beta-hexosaminidase C-terminal domain-containing protein [Muribaculaceae bacterium]|nr:chitobiase/beta-hexosaminidase C-terminal domain-containing protein [Muribaculaceae bacterium]
MKHLFTLILSLCVVLGANAAVVSFDFANNEFNLPTTTNTADSKGAFDNPVSKDGITLTFSKNSADIAPLMYFSAYNNTTTLRCYKGNVFSVACTTGNTIVAIEFVNAGKLNVAATPVGEWTGDTFSTWTGEGATINFDVNGSTQVTKIIVTTSDKTGVAAPTFVPVATELYEPQSITLKCATMGANIYYTLDGTAPSVASTKYTAPFNISNDTKVRAIAELNGTLSDIAEIDYTFPAHTVVSNIATFLASTETDKIRIDKDLAVAYQSGKYLFLRDDDGGALQVYGDVEKTYNNGDIIPAGIVGTKNIFYGTTQFLPIVSTFKPVISTTTAAPIEVALSSVDASLANAYIIGYNWNVTIVKNGNYFNYTLSDDAGHTIAVYERFKNITMPVKDGKYNVTGIVNVYNGTLQIYPTNFAEGTGIDTAQQHNSNTITATEGGIIVNTHTPTTVEIYTPSGTKVASVKVEGTSTINLAAGIYIATTPSATTKLAVK